MIDYIRDIDFDKYHSFFLEYSKIDDKYDTHVVRLCTHSYKEIMSKNGQTSLMLEGAVMTFKHETLLPEVLMECSLIGISIDFIDIYAKNDDKESERWRRSERKCIQVIDCHKEDVAKMFEKIEAKQHYLALNVKKNDILKFLVIDRFKQDSKVSFLKGEYDKKAIVAGFRDQKEARNYCEKLNKGI